VDRIITDQQLLVRHAQWYTQNILDEKHNQRSPDDVPADDEQSANYLAILRLTMSKDRS
jgi:hypothetical protein